VVRDITPAVRFRGFTFTYRQTDTPAVRNVDLDIEHGAFFALLGHNGSGKSTLCSTLNGVVPQILAGHIKGSLEIDGITTSSRTVASLSTTVGVVLQDADCQLVTTRVDLEVAFGPENLALPRAELLARVDRYLSIVELEPHRLRNPATLSAGEKQRLAIASVLALEPNILVMDEPSTHLDARGRDDLVRILRRWIGDSRTVIITEHDTDLAAAADGIAILRNGIVVASGPAQSILGDREMLEVCGVRAPELVELFDSLGLASRPTTVAEASEILRPLVRPEPVSGEPKESAIRSPGSPLVDLVGAGVSYPNQDVPALSAVSLTITTGEYLAVVGCNGSGKTTLAKVIGGLLTPTIGKVRYWGSAPADRPTGHVVSYVSADPFHQFFAQTVHEEIAYGPRNLGLSGDEVEERVRESLDAVGLVGVVGANPFSLGTSTQRRLSTASALALAPRIIIFDEPTVGLDHDGHREFVAMLRRLNSSGITIIVITHDLRLVAEEARRTVALAGGVVIADGGTADVLRRLNASEEARLMSPLIVRLAACLDVAATTANEMTAFIDVRCTAQDPTDPGAR
jgi:energy-coupling factor transport system ATP-binding protein